MSSSNQLSAGQKLKLPVLKGKWMKANNERGFSIQVSQNVKKPIARYFSVCYTAPKTGWKDGVKRGECCSAHIKANGPTRDELEVVSVDLNHTCPPDGPRRVRNYRTVDISTASDVLASYEPTRTKEGNAKQFIKMAKTFTGFTMKVGAACKAIQSKRHETLEAQIGQFLLLPSAFEAFKEADPGGTFKLEDKDCRWDNNKRQFHRCYVALSIGKHYWKHTLIKLFVCDGTFTKLGAFKHILLLAVTFDGNNQVIILGFAIVDVENSNNWVLKL